MAAKSWLDNFLFIFQDKTTKIAYFKIYNPTVKSISSKRILSNIDINKVDQ